MSWEDNIRKANIERAANVIKSIYSDEIQKARSGIYADTSYNRKKGRVGQRYGESKQEEESKKKEDKEIKLSQSAEKLLNSLKNAFNFVGHIPTKLPMIHGVPQLEEEGLIKVVSSSKNYKTLKLTKKGINYKSNK